jgi:hypothetical protein
MSIVRPATRLPIVRKFELSANIPLLSVDDCAGPDYMDGVGSNQASDPSNETQMTAASFDLVVNEAERIWRNQFPNRRENTRTAQMQIGALLMQARRNLKENGVKIQ